MIKIVYGNEPYLIDAERAKLCRMITVPKLNLLYTDTFSVEESYFLDTCPVIDNVRVVIVTVSHIKELNTKAFREYLNFPSPTGELLVIAKTVDNSKFFKDLCKKNIVFPCEKITDSQTLQKLVLREIGASNAKITNNAYMLFMQYENYLERDDITFLNVISDIHTLISYSKEITVDTVKLLIKKNPSNNLWGLIKLIKKKDIASLREQAALQAGNEIATLSALLREYRIGYKTIYFPKAEICTGTIFLNDIPKSTLISGLNIIQSAIDGLKKGSIPVNTALLFVFERLCLEDMG